MTKKQITNRFILNIVSDSEMELEVSNLNVYYISNTKQILFVIDYNYKTVSLSSYFMCRITGFFPEITRKDVENIIIDNIKIINSNNDKRTNRQELS